MFIQTVGLSVVQEITRDFDYPIQRCKKQKPGSIVYPGKMDVGCLIRIVASVFWSNSFLSDPIIWLVEDKVWSRFSSIIFSALNLVVKRGNNMVWQAVAPRRHNVFQYIYKNLCHLRNTCNYTPTLLGESVFSCFWKHFQLWHHVGH